MWDWTASARTALSQSHTPVSLVEVWHSGTPVYTLAVTDGEVTIDAARAVRRNLSASLVDPTGDLTRGDVRDLLDPYECEIAPFRGVLLNGRTEVAPLGVFGLTGRAVEDSPDGISIRLTGQDRAMTYQGPMSSALGISGGTPIEDAIMRLLATRNPGVNLSALRTGFTCGPLLYEPDIDVWAEAQKLAESVGARLFHDRTGQAVLALSGPASPFPVASYSEGDGLLLSVSRTEDSDTIRNVVVAESVNGAIRAVAEDTDPYSPTFAGGRYGRRVAPLISQHFGSVSQAQQAAASRLAYELGRSETVTFTAIPDAARDVDEVITVHRPEIGLNQRGVIVASASIPLSEEDVMTIGCRQSRIAQDGQVIPLAEDTP